MVVVVRKESYQGRIDAESGAESDHDGKTMNSTFRIKDYRLE